MVSATRKKKLLRALQHSMEWDFDFDEFVKPDEVWPVMIEMVRDKAPHDPRLLSHIAWEIGDFSDVSDEERALIWDYLDSLLDRPHQDCHHNNRGWSWFTASFFDRLVEVGLRSEDLEPLNDTYRAQGLLLLYLAGHVEVEDLDESAVSAFARARIAPDYDGEAWGELESKIDPDRLDQLTLRAAVSPSTPMVDWSMLEPRLAAIDESDLPRLVQNVWGSVNTLNPFMTPDPTPPEAPVQALATHLTEEQFGRLARALVALAVEEGSADVGVERHAAGLASLGAEGLRAMLDVFDDAPAEASVLLVAAIGQTGLDAARAKLESVKEADKRKTVRQAASEALQNFQPREGASQREPEHRIDELVVAYEALAAIAR